MRSRTAKSRCCCCSAAPSSFRVPRGSGVSQIPWDKEASFRLPVRVWREMMNRYFPNSGWLRLHTDTLNLLMRCKARRAVASWDQLMLSLLKDAGETEQ